MSWAPTEPPPHNISQTGFPGLHEFPQSPAISKHAHRALQFGSVVENGLLSRAAIAALPADNDTEFGAYDSEVFPGPGTLS